MDIIERHKDQLEKLCQQYNVDKMYLFGSARTSRFTINSDIDFLVKFKPIDLAIYFDNYLDFKENLQELFGRDVDLLEEQALRNPILINTINKSKELVYG